MSRSSIHYVQVFVGGDGQWYYEPRAHNNETLSTSEGYTRGADALRAAEDAYPSVEIRVEGAEPILDDRNRRTGWSFPA